MTIDSDDRSTCIELSVRGTFTKFELIHEKFVNLSGDGTLTFLSKR